MRDRAVAALAPLGPRKLHPFVAEDALEGGLELGATLATGTLQHRAGMLHGDGLLMLTMAERAPPALAVRLGQALDARPGLAVVALDEAAEDDEALPQALAERLGLFVALDDIAWSDTRAITLDMARVAQARAQLATIGRDDAAPARLVGMAARLGIASLRAPWLALACARAHAAWRGGTAVTDDDLRVAAELVLAHPDAPPPPDDPPPSPDPGDDADAAPPPPDEGAGDDSDAGSSGVPDEMLIAAAQSALPPGVLARLQAARMARAAAAGSSSGAGARRKSRARGRPLPSRPGKPGAGARIDVVATLRQAAPWQPMRRAARPGAPAGRLLLMPSDIRLRRFQDRSDRVLIFVVDASGSAAVARLAEAKGAVELMLADAYSSRDHVALVTFRGAGAELALPPTRSLVQAKRRLAGLPGGGATPLAGALKVALDTALAARGRGMAPTLAVLTDGRGNIALDGRADRAQAGTDAATLARAIAARALPSLVIDTSARPRPQLAELADAMGATRIALPRADARALSATLGAALGG